MPNSPELLTDIATRHQVYLERYKTGVFDQYGPFLVKMTRSIRKSLSNNDIEDVSRLHLEKLIRSINKDLKLIQGEYNEEVFIPSSLELASYEAEFEVKSLKQVVKAEFTIPTENQLKTAILTNPLSAEGYEGKLLTPFVKDLSDKSINDITNNIRLGFSQGLSTPEIIKNIIGTKKRGYTDGELLKLNQSTEATVRTGLQHVSNQARQQTWKNNDDIVVGFNVVVTFDGRTSSICRGYGSTPNKIYKVGVDPSPPFHIRCLTGDTNISTSSRISNVYKRTYEGSMVKIVTESDRVIKITPNHPILTRNGWKAAEDINVSDQVVCIDRSLFVAHDENTVISKFSKLFSSLNISSNSSFVRIRPMTAEDFHGDVTNSEVKIINTNSFGNSKINSFIDKDISNNWFIFRKIINSSFFGLSLFNSRVNRDSNTSSIIVTRSNLMRSLFGSFKRPFDSFLFTLTSYVNVIFSKNSLNNTRGNSETIGDTANTSTMLIKINNIFNKFIRKDDGVMLPNDNTIALEDIRRALFTDADDLGDFLNSKQINGVKFDNVVNVELFNYSGHVYNLENKVNWYCSNDIITHNCRSTTTAALDPKWDFLDKGATRTSRGPDGKVKKIDADTDYYSWLKTQPASFQDDILGKTRGKLLREGGLTAKRFGELQLNKKFEPLTLKEMKKREPLAFERIEA